MLSGEPGSDDAPSTGFAAHIQTAAWCLGTGKGSLPVECPSQLSCRQGSSSLPGLCAKALGTMGVISNLGLKDSYIQRDRDLAVS